MEILIFIICLLNLVISTVFLLITISRRATVKYKKLPARHGVRKPLWNNESKEIIAEQREAENIARS